MSHFKAIMHYFLNIKSYYYPCNKIWVCTEKEKALVQKMKQQWQHVMSFCFYISAFRYLNCVNFSHVPKHCHGTLFKRFLQCLTPRMKPEDTNSFNYKIITTNFANRMRHKISTCTYCTSAVWSKSVKEKEIYARYVTPYTYLNMVLVLIPIKLLKMSHYQRLRNLI
jgi:hypothetical protein